MRARVALLGAHAHCAVLASSAAEGSATARVVRQAQSPHLQLLLDGWLGCAPWLQERGCAGRWGFEGKLPRHMQDLALRPT